MELIFVLLTAGIHCILMSIFVVVSIISTYKMKD
jgi:hypothetical protein